MKNIALLLDLDNIKPNLNELETICQGYGKIVVRRAFSNTSTVLTAYGSRFRELNYRFEITPSLDTVSQEVDNLIFKTAEEILQNPSLNINLIAVVSNDNDYAKLFTNLKNKGIQTLAIGIGNQMGNSLRESSNYVEILSGVMRPMYIGIDLGTTNTVMALASENLMKQWISSVVEVPIKDEQSALIQSNMIPSSVRFISNNNTEVGRQVKALAYPYRDRTILAWKHDMGITENGQPFQYNLTIGNITPEEAASKVLEFCRNKLLERYGTIQGAVITHPACYEIDAISATRKAAVLAGWQEEDVVLISEPQAALYDFLYHLQQGHRYVPFEFNKPVNILVYDLGGGTLDVTLHEVEWDHQKNRFIINDLAIGSRTRIGGDIVDNLISEYILKNHQDFANLSEVEKNKLRYELPIYAEKFKKVWGSQYLQSQDKTNFNYTFQGLFLDAKFPIRHNINTQKMQEILASLFCEDLSLDVLEHLEPETAFNLPPFSDRLNTLVVPILEVLLKAKQTQGIIPVVDGILLNGGMTYFPLIKERLIKLFPSVPILDDSNPDLAVARGASLYAAGVLKSKETINPTNLSLEVTQNNQFALRTLIAQGQKYPYKTVLSGFKLPKTETGYLLFKIWSGMGNKPNFNTNLQRLRQVSVDEILASQLSAGSLLDLEIEYTFDEKLLLTLVSRNNQARYQLEIATDTKDLMITEPTITNVTVNNNVNIKNIVPSISRYRKNKILSLNSEKINITEWENLVKDFQENFNAKNSNTKNVNNGKLHQRKKELAKKTALAENRLEIAGNFIQWLQKGLSSLNEKHPIKLLLAVRGLTQIFELCNEEETTVKTLENAYKLWIQNRLKTDLSNINFHLFNEIVNVPGKLFWDDLTPLLIDSFERHQSKGIATQILNSLGKCGKINQDLALLSLLSKTIKESSRLSYREKAFWALGRLISLGQPEEYRVSFEIVEFVANLALEELLEKIKEPQIAMTLIRTLSQCLAWQTMDYNFSKDFFLKINSLPKKELPVNQYLSKFPRIAVTFKERLQLLPKIINISEATEAEIKEIETFLIESIKD